MWLAIFHLVTQPLYLITHLNEYLLSDQTCTMQTIFRSIKPKQIEDFNKVFTTEYHNVSYNKNVIYQCNASCNAEWIENFITESKLLFGMSRDYTVTLTFQNPKDLWGGILYHPQKSCASLWCIKMKHT